MDARGPTLAVSRRRLAVSVFLAGAALVLVPWSIGLAHALPCRYLSRHWGIAWAGFDGALAATFALTSIAAVRHAPWLDRVAVAAVTLLAADAWFDVVTARSAVGVALATAEAVAVEFPIALLCLWVAQRLTTPGPRVRHTTAPSNPKGVLQ
jgi:hypothetical protein